MAITADFHTHTNFSGDSKAPMEEMIQQAILLGFDTLCITDHHDNPYPYTHGELRDLFMLDVINYQKHFQLMKERYQDQIQLLCGVEIGVQSKYAEVSYSFTNEHTFDFIIASSHLSDEKDPYYMDFFDDKEEDAAYGEYFQSIIDNIRTFQDFDIYGHLDYVVRYGPNKNKYYSYKKYQDYFDEILRLIIQHNKGIEVNTSGLKYGLGHAHPHSDILKRYKELGGTILTVGSDAHAKEHLGYEFSSICDLLLSIGFEYYTIFQERTPIFRPLA